MKKKRLGCLTLAGLVAVFVTLLVVVGVSLAQGGVLYSPGALSARTGAQSLGGVRSHAEIGGKCRDCHTSPLDGQKMADRCQACHTDLLQDARSFHSVMLAQSQVVTCYRCHPDHNGPNAPTTNASLKDFPHNKIGFSLQSHQKKADGSAFACSDCHGADFTHFDQQTCITCHSKIDATFIQAHVEAFGQDCRACHDGVDSYGHAFDHNKLTFQLQGKHASVSCAGCHQGAKNIADLKATPQNCSACHAKDDAHNGRLGQDCGKCHVPDDWKQATFDHNQAAFKLLGRHATVDCAACHANNVFKGTPQDCHACHAKDDHHTGQFGTDCGKCHVPDDWKQATFDHNLSPFKLVGAHATVDCAACHVNNVFQGTPQDCHSCHSKDDHHNGQFGTDCGACHTPDAWLPATFDHSKSAFPLTGAHLTLQCTQCHVNNVFTGTPTTCVSCHAQPAYHLGLFGTGCATCHTTGGWSPALFKGPHAFPIRHGGARTCRNCHPANLMTWTCYSCHNQAEMIAKHRGEGITNISNCIGCHPSGQGGD